MFSRHIFALSSLAFPRRPRFALKPAAALLFAALGVGSLRADDVPANLALGLGRLTKDYQAARPAGSTTLSHGQFNTVKAKHPFARTDPKDRVLVDVYLDGTKTPNQIIKVCHDMGCMMTARADWYRRGAFSTYLPLSQAAALARTPGVSAVNLSPKPMHHVGLTTSQGAKVLKSDLVNTAGYRGTGITVGVLSDSFDTNRLGTTQPTTTAAQDATNGDLPGTGNPDGYTTPVNVLQDYGTATTPGTDEGRAMCQIVHDVAPASPIAFATADSTEIGFADNIIALAGPTNQAYTVPVVNPDTGLQTGTTTVNGAGCKVICDDVSYFDEPMFSDGVVAQAVDQVTTTRGVSYFSSAGNDGNSGYSTTFKGVPNNTANQTLLSTQGKITYANIPVAERNAISSFHSFGTDANGNPILVQRVLIPLYYGQTTAQTGIQGILSFQWDDPSNVTDGSAHKQVTTDYDVLIFSLNGAGTVATYQDDNLGGNDTNVGAGGTNQPVELAGYFSLGTTYEFVVVQTNRTVDTGVTANQASHIRWVMLTDAQQVIADFNTPNSPESFGHSCAQNCNGTAAYVYDADLNTAAATYNPFIEIYSSNGAPQIYFDAAGNRLATPISRKQPTLAGVDGVDTSFFGSDADGDTFPNFFGTSAASPHGAGCAAVLLNAAAANSITLTPADVRSLLTSTTQGQQDLDPALSQSASGPLTLQAKDRGTYTDPGTFFLNLSSSATGALTQLVFNLAPIGDAFFTNAYPVTGGFGTTPSGTAPTIATKTLSGNVGSSTVVGTTETITFSNFNPGATLGFGVAVAPTAGGSAQAGDGLAGATYTATIGGTTFNGTLANTTGRKWNYKSGYGLMDVNAAVNRLLGH